MPTFRLEKLVRAGLPKIFKDLGQVAEIKELSGDNLEEALIAKFHEEIDELQNAGHLDLKELADISQIVRDAAIANGSSPEELESLRIEREKDRGPLVVVDGTGATKGYYVSRVRCQDDDPWVQYYRNEPERFPEEAA